MKAKVLRLVVLSMMVMVCLTGCGAGENSSLGMPENKEESNEKSGKNNSHPVGDYTIEIGGEEYTFPMSYDEFKDRGWVYYMPEYDDPSQWKSMLQADYHTGGLFYDNGDIKALEFIFYNPTDEPVTYDQCEVVGFEVEYDQTIDGIDAEGVMSIPEGSIKVNGTSIGSSSKEEVVEKVGKDRDLIENPDADLDNFQTFLYYLDSEEALNRVMLLSFDSDGTFDEISYINVPD